MSLRPDPSIGFSLQYSQPPHRTQEEFKARSEHRLNFLKFLRVLQPDGNILFEADPDDFVPIGWKPADGKDTTPVDVAWFPFDGFQIGYANISKPDVSPGAHYVKDYHHPQRSHELYEPLRGQGRVLTLLSIRNTVVASRHLGMHEMPLTQSMDLIICGYNWEQKSICWAFNPARREEFITRDSALSNWVPSSEIDAKIEAVKPQLMRAYHRLIHQGNDQGGPI